VISSTRNPTVQSVRRLRKPVFRDREETYLAEGTEPLRSALEAAVPVRRVFALPGAASRREALLKEAAAAGARTHTVTPQVMAYLTGTGSPPELLSIIELRTATLETLSRGPGLLLAGVSDPRVVGAAMSCVEATGGRFVVVARGTADVFGEKTVRAARGAHVRLQVVRDVAASDALASLRSRGDRIIGLVDDGKPPWQIDLVEPFVLALGKQVAGACDEEVTIPGRGDLPLTAQVGAILAEAVRQRGLG
jgi:RNA methyltransferase, TrmH family